MLLKLLLLVVTLVFMSSVGGAFLGAAPLLLPLHWIAARDSKIAGRVFWGVVAGVLAAEVAWAGIYLVLGEARPFIWLAPLLALCATTLLFVHKAGRAHARRREVTSAGL